MELSYFKNEILRKDPIGKEEAPDIRGFRRILSGGGLELERLKQKVKTDRIDKFEEARRKIRELFRKHLLDFIFLGAMHLLQVNPLFFPTTVLITNDDLGMHEIFVEVAERFD